MVSSKSTPHIPLSKHYWLIVASRDHVRKGISDSFCQANHGKKAPLQRMSVGDGVVFYSAKTKYKSSEICQKFTGIGTVSNKEIFQVKFSDGFEPWRRKVEFQEAIEDASILPLIERLDFITNKKAWGASLRFGFLKIGKDDFEIIERAMSELRISQSDPD